MSHIQIKLSDEAMQVIRAAGGNGREVLKGLIKEHIDEFEKHLSQRAETPFNDRLVPMERTLLQTMLLDALTGEQPDAPR